MILAVPVLSLNEIPDRTSDDEGNENAQIHQQCNARSLFLLGSLEDVRAEILHQLGLLACVDDHAGDVAGVLDN